MQSSIYIIQGKRGDVSFVTFCSQALMNYLQFATIMKKYGAEKDMDVTGGEADM